LSEICQKKKEIIIQNVNNWLEEEEQRYAFGIIYDPKTDLNISISFDEYTGCNVILTKNNSLLLIVTQVTFSEQDKKIFAHLKKENKLVFIQELVYSLSQVNVQYSIYPDSENMEYIQIRHIIYFDGLTKNSLFHGISEVIRAIGLARLVYQKDLQICPSSNMPNIDKVLSSS
jgi:hypothetical protein